jgi:hypothetical protein
MLLRMKAMLNIADTAQPTVLHAVQGLLHRPIDLKAWPNDIRKNRVILIGRDVEEQILVDALARLSAIAGVAVQKSASSVTRKVSQSAR